MNFYSISALLATFTGFSLAFLSYIKSRNRREVRVFVLVTLLATIWTLCPISVAFLRDKEDLLLNLIRILYIFVVFIPPAIFHLMIVVADRDKLKIEKYALNIFYFISLLFLIVVFNPLFISSINLDKPYFSIEPGIFYNLFSLFFIIVGIYGFTKPIIAIKTSKKGYVLIRSKYFFIGGLIGIFSALLHFSAVYFNFEPFPHDFLLISYFTIIAYAIVKYRLMDIRLVLTKSILYFFLVLFVALSFTFVTFTTAQFFQGQGQVIVTLIVSLIIVIFLDPLKRLLAKWTDKFFYKGKIDFQKVLRDIGEIIAAELDLQKLLASMESSLVNKIKVKYVKVLLAKKEGGSFLFVNNDNKEKLTEDSLLLQHIQSKQAMLITEELIRQKADLKSEAEKEEIDELEAELDAKEVGLVVPIMTEGKMTAIFLIGQKLSGSPFTQEEINFFDVLAPQAATALEKSKLYEEVQEYSFGLQEKVRQATAELEERNRYLMALQRLTNVITRSLDYSKVMQTIADGIASQLDFIGGMLNFIDFEKRTVSIGAITRTKGIEKVLKLVPQDPTSYSVSLDEPDNIAMEAIRTKKIQVSDSFWDFVKPAIPKTLCQAIQKVLGAKSIVAVPVYSEEKVIGVIDFVLAKEASQITNTEREMMRALADQVGIVSRNLHYYQEIQRANEELKHVNIRLQQLDRAKSEFLSIASHQLRTPLTGIKGYLSMIVEGDYGEVPPQIKRILDDVFLNTDRLTRLINIFLNVSRIESGRFDLTLKDVDLIELTEKVIAESKPLADKKQVKLIFHKPKRLIPHLKLDMDKIKDVLLNLIDNSIKYTPEGKVEVFVTQEDHQIKISVKDTGVGILKSEVGELFKKFVRGIGIAQIDTSGSGLGLYIAKKIVEAHGGEIWAESEGKGQGATFSFVLPIK